jgi:hypothetical protein
MNILNKIARMFAAIMLVALASVAFVSAASNLHESMTAQAAPIGVESIKTFTGSVATETPVITGATGKKLHVRSMEIASSVGGVVVFKDGTAGTTVANIYLIANTPRDITNLFGAGGLGLSQNVLTATLAGSTLTLNARTSDE